MVTRVLVRMEHDANWCLALEWVLQWCHQWYYQMLVVPCLPVLPPALVQSAGKVLQERVVAAADISQTGGTLTSLGIAKMNVVRVISHAVNRMTRANGSLTATVAKRSFGRIVHQCDESTRRFPISRAY